MSTPQIGDFFINEECLIFQIIFKAQNGEYICKRNNGYTTEGYTTFHINEIEENQVGGYWLINAKGLANRFTNWFYGEVA